MFSDGKERAFFVLWGAGIFPFRVKILVWFVEVVV